MTIFYTWNINIVQTSSRCTHCLCFRALLSLSQPFKFRPPWEGGHRQAAQDRQASFGRRWLRKTMAKSWNIPSAYLT